MLAPKKLPIDHPNPVRQVEPILLRGLAQSAINNTPYVVSATIYEEVAASYFSSADPYSHHQTKFKDSHKRLGNTLSWRRHLLKAFNTNGHVSSLIND